MPPETTRRGFLPTSAIAGGPALAPSLFDDQIQRSLNQLQKNKEVAAQVKVKPEMCFTGFDAYKKVIDACDVVLLTTTPHFRPMHLKAAIEAGKHVFAEKPLAVDAPGVRSVLETCAQAKARNLS